MPTRTDNPYAQAATVQETTPDDLRRELRPPTCFRTPRFVRGDAFESIRDALEVLRKERLQGLEVKSR
jgi:hypothetical protein